MTKEVPGADDPTEAEYAAIRAATADDVRAVDAMILEVLSARWQKVAKVVGQLLNDFDRKFEHLPYAYIRARLEKLEDLGKLEITGDVWAMHNSEVRLPNHSEAGQREA